jgi:hypothetical protein
MAFELKGIKSFTRFWALLMFGSYSVINIIVLLNMLIAMMSNSYQIISVSIQQVEALYTFSSIQKCQLVHSSFVITRDLRLLMAATANITAFWDVRPYRSEF